MRVYCDTISLKKQLYPLNLNKDHIVTKTSYDAKAWDGDGRKHCKTYHAA